MDAMRPWLTAAALILAAALTLAMVVPLQLSDIVAQSDLIVRGKVVGLESNWTADRSTIQTDVTLQVLDVVASRLHVQEDVTFRVDGGRIGEQEMRTSVDPEFNEGDEGIFFLQFDADLKHLTLVGRSQGYFPTEDGTVTVDGEAMALEQLMSQIHGVETMSDPLTIEGVLTDEGVTCPALRGDDGELYTIAGEIGELRPGQRVRVTGEVAEMSMCMQGTTIALGDITPLP